VATPIGTTEREIVLVEHARIRQIMSPTSSNLWPTGRIPYSLVDLFILVHEAVVPITPGRASLDMEPSRRPPAAGALK